MKVADLNHDGRGDIVVANEERMSVQVLLGRGDGTLDAAVSFGIGPDPNDLEVADLNGDGHLDIATVNYVSRSISVLLGRGDGSFEEQSVFGTGDRPVSISVADLNGDGLLDVAAGNFLGDRISLLWNRSSMPSIAVPEVSRPLPDTTDGRWHTSLDAVPLRRDGEVRISYRIGPAPAATSLAVFDVAGRHVRLLERQPRQPGSYIHTWDRRDDSGRRVARGVYILRLQADNVVASRKLLVLHD
jgi:hypothetical protein